MHLFEIPEPSPYLPLVRNATLEEAIQLIKHSAFVYKCPKMYPSRFDSDDTEGWYNGKTWSLRLKSVPNSDWPRDAMFGLAGGPSSEPGKRLWFKEPFRGCVVDNVPHIQFQAGGMLRPSNRFESQIMLMLVRGEPWQPSEILPERFVRLRFLSKGVIVTRINGELVWKAEMERDTQPYTRQ
jgi:hypothetical protein